MLLASGDATTPEDRVRDARRMIDFLEEVSSADSAMARIIADSKAHALGFADSYLLHDELETFNSPCYFYEMLGRASAHGLAFLAEARPESMVPGNYGPKVTDYLLEKCGGVQVLVEQYLDFVADRTFRETLLVHAERAPQIQYNPAPARVRDFHIAAWVPPVDGETRLDHSRQEFEQLDGATLFTNDPGIKAALGALSARWPWTLSREELVAAVRERLTSAGLTPSDSVPDTVDNLIGVLILQGQARFRLHPVRPDAASVPLRLDEPARRAAELAGGHDQASTFNLWHETHILSPLDRHLLPMLDGTRDRDALIEGLLAALRESHTAVDRDEVVAWVDTLPQRLMEMKLSCRT
jgi:methyltransferase-like protein